MPSIIIPYWYWSKSLTVFSSLHTRYGNPFKVVSKAIINPDNNLTSNYTVQWILFITVYTNNVNECLGTCNSIQNTKGTVQVSALVDKDQWLLPLGLRVNDPLSNALLHSWYEICLKINVIMTLFGHLNLRFLNSVMAIMAVETRVMDTIFV